MLKGFGCCQAYESLSYRNPRAADDCYGDLCLGMCLAGALAGAAASLLFGVLALTFLTNQYAAGLALAIFGSGVSAFLGRGFGSEPIEALHGINVAVLSDLPPIGPLLFRFDPMVYLALVMFAAISWFLYHTKAGLILRTIGESPQTSHAIGYPVIRNRYMAVLFGGARAGLAGAYLSVAYTPLWVENSRQGLDRVGAGGVRHLAATAHPARRMAVRRHDDPSIAGAGARTGSAIRTAVGPALSRYHHRTGSDLTKPANAGAAFPGFAGKAFPSGRLSSRVRDRRPARNTSDAT
ncbi:hypothetical protein [Mesorhizobium sp. M7D.F.Ca.US.005.01.1.1]|uniref:ABC transporter permease subunit n=1 Tax=Mesorhizobium sp. M7D.F.Ca.US.005.01.1.1 TaxID=2493678 RepID=UPI001FDFBE76|nr:hypothetical protein [Mesorhizobium sp. M7D.F.Ca.US.005.01.1.1]